MKKIKLLISIILTLLICFGIVLSFINKDLFFDSLFSILLVLEIMLGIKHYKEFRQ